MGVETPPSFSDRFAIAATATGLSLIIHSGRPLLRFSLLLPGLYDMKPLCDVTRICVRWHACVRACVCVCAYVWHISDNG